MKTHILSAVRLCLFSFHFTTFLKMAPSLPAEQNVEELLKETQLRWFNASEMCSIFANYGSLNILTSQRQKTPPSGSFFAIKRHMVRDFKKDGHKWTKKKDGKTAQEAHERLKVNNVEMLQCLYVHGQDNENFQRRIYWMLEKEPSGIALFHYREAKRNRKRCEPEKDITEERPANSFGDCHIICQLNIEWQNPATNFGNIPSEMLRIRFEKLLSRSSVCSNYDDSNIGKFLRLYFKIKPLLKEEDVDWGQIISSEMVKEKIMKEKLHVWLLQKVGEGGNGLTELDEGGQGVLHFAAALGYNWALEATVAAGVKIDSPDVNGWTALHWAAYCRRQHTVMYLLTLGALSYPTPKYPLGHSSVVLGSNTEHQGTSGHL
ncbi:calmodulin-binding transcription activator 3-like isoform X1 [Mangifera indica]|uniref:calmodulin-binding transcription activator 3-like isoform X1 n=1 Tax=Mangifera indica TaxID=29780 RepID=UPI001CFB2A6A|nr:calmodulin-binding transcription activator 3-like isoform X1 [Mangifera indica]